MKRLSLVTRAYPVRLMVFDVDGVLTDGRLWINDTGEELKAFHTLDGLGLKMLQQSGVKIAWISARYSRVVEHRANELGVWRWYHGAEEKLPLFKSLLEELRLSPEASGFMGDDVIDLPSMCYAGLAVTVPLSPEVVKQHAHYVTEHAGGAGAVREVCDAIMKAQNTLDQQLAPYLPIGG